jgi:hypothetical protein
VPVLVVSLGRYSKHPPAGAVVQEVIDVAAVLNALRAALPARALTDY